MDWAAYLSWLRGEPWLGSPGVPALIGQHILYSALPTLAALLVALPIGLYTGHTGRGGMLAMNIANVGRAIPSFGLLIASFVFFGLSLTPVLVTLTALAIPPILTNTYVGIRQVDPDIRNAAEGMGMTGRQLLWRVEGPLALPLIMAGIRTSAVQVVATATLAAIVALEGLGRPIVNGLAQGPYAPNSRALVVTGAVLVALLAIGTDAGLARAERAVTPAGLPAPAGPDRARAAVPPEPGGGPAA